MAFIFKVQTRNFVCGIRRSFAFTMKKILSVWYTATPGWTPKFGKVWKTRCQNGATRANIWRCFLVSWDDKYLWVMGSNNRHELYFCSKLLCFSSIHCFFGQIRYLNIRHDRTLTSSPLMFNWSERCRETREREPAHTGWCLIIQPQKFPRYFEIESYQNWFTSLFQQRWSLWCSAVSFGYISFITFWQFVCITSFYLSLTAILTSHFSNITYFRKQQQQHKPMKYYEILPTHTETPCNTTRKIANLYIEFNCHFLTLQKKFHYFWTGVYLSNSMKINLICIELKILFPAQLTVMVPINLPMHNTDQSTRLQLKKTHKTPHRSPSRSSSGDLLWVFGRK